MRKRGASPAFLAHPVEAVDGVPVSGGGDNSQDTIDRAVPQNAFRDSVREVEVNLPGGALALVWRHGYFGQLFQSVRRWGLGQEHDVEFRRIDSSLFQERVACNHLAHLVGRSGND